MGKPMVGMGKLCKGWPFCHHHHDHPIVTLSEIRTFQGTDGSSIYFCREQTFSNCLDYKEKLENMHYVYSGGCQDQYQAFGFECPTLQTTITAQCGRGNTEQVTRKTYAHHSS